jgi:erythromycin esterase-like protein
VQQLFGFLATQVDSGKVKLGGLDFQAGGFEQPYGNDVMFTELTSRLPVGRRDFCRTLYHARAWGDDPPNGITVAALAEALKSCLLDIGSDIGAAEGHPGERADQQSQLTNLQAWLANDGASQQELVRSRDRMMAENASHFIDQLAKPAKVIIWTANGHAARDTSALGDYGGGDNLGAALSRRYGSKVFSMGVTACGGEHRWSPGTNKAITVPPGDSLEARYCEKSDVSTFVGSRGLELADVCTSGLLGHSYTRAKWADAFDGVLVLNAEYPPHSTRP